MERKKIFISSTCYDLIDTRAELYVFLKDNGFDTILSDMSESSFNTIQNVDSIESCLVNLRSSDIVIMIIDKRYGPSLAPEYEDISATHLEYKEAIRTKKDVYFFVRDRFLADYNIYNRRKGKVESKDLVWIKDSKDFKLFDFFKEHAKLKKGKNNWYDTFRSSVDLKNMLKQKLQFEINKNKFSKLLDSGNLPLIDLSLEWKNEIFSNSDYSEDKYVLNLTNHGNSSAININVLIAKKSNYEKTGDDPMKLFGVATHHSIKSIKSNETASNITYSFRTFKIMPHIDDIEYIVKVFYTTMQGFRVADIVGVEFYSDSDIRTHYIGKEYISDKAIEIKMLSTNTTGR